MNSKGWPSIPETEHDHNNLNIQNQERSYGPRILPGLFFETDFSPFGQANKEGFFCLRLTSQRNRRLVMLWRNFRWKNQYISGNSYASQEYWLGRASRVF
jgi:hypothetical protein